MVFLKLNGGARNIATALALLTISAQSASAEVLVLLCKGTSHCSTCRESEKQVHFDWTYANCPVRGPRGPHRALWRPFQRSFASQYALTGY